ncbi:EHN domain-containing protein [Mycena chlorophos]|uniref:EHN domain-containing protein n=1 Tax=Mycena chlorophos TaxID=658473 RepID=A0A8H6SQT9_MYCCL|nr:EHN domain-containing protein [Mycena chlorophos]
MTSDSERWGSESPFTISIPDSELSALQARLALTRLPDELEDVSGGELGAPLADIQRLVSRWKDGFDWRKEEASLNAELPQFTRDVEIDGFGKSRVHYVHQRSEREDAIPLLFVHGWPGNFLEVRKILPLLVSAPPEHPTFHVVAFSLPGFGFSEAPKKKGFKLDQYAETGHKLMLALGYEQYITQGGDLGFSITRRIAQRYAPAHSKAWHTNFPVAHHPPFLASPLAYLRAKVTPYSDFEKATLARRIWFVSKGWGYHTLQSTKPQTIGYSLTDSPVGLLSWVYEKLVDWTDGYKWEDDEVLTWISLMYFSTAGPAASLRIYNEIATEKPGLFPKELSLTAKTWMRPLGNTVFESEHTKGGHFAAHEVPELLVDDLRRMFGKGGPAYGVVPGKNGYNK